MFTSAQPVQASEKSVERATPVSGLTLHAPKAGGALTAMVRLAAPDCTAPVDTTRSVAVRVMVMI
jgi:hypothetical protein